MMWNLLTQHPWPQLAGIYIFHTGCPLTFTVNSISLLLFSMAFLCPPHDKAVSVLCMNFYEILASTVVSSISAVKHKGADERNDK
jgi:hypothetical protein